MTDPFAPFREWLTWLDSHDGRLARRKAGGKENDYDYLCTLPPGGSIFTVGDLRRLVQAGGKQ